LDTNAGYTKKHNANSTILDGDPRTQPGTLLQLKSTKTLWRVVEKNPESPGPVTNSRRGSVIQVVREDWVDKSIGVFMYSNDFTKVTE
jgi:hypothetical protein